MAFRLNPFSWRQKSPRLDSEVVPMGSPELVATSDTASSTAIAELKIRETLDLFERDVARIVGTVAADIDNARAKSQLSLTHRSRAEGGLLNKSRRCLLL